MPTSRLYEWLADRAGAAGFSVGRDSLNIQPGYIDVKKGAGGHGHRLRSVHYEGILEVTDCETLLKTLVRGIGPGKAFGFGLISVAPINLPAVGEAG